MSKESPHDIHAGQTSHPVIESVDKRCYLHVGGLGPPPSMTWPTRWSDPATRRDGRDQWASPRAADGGSHDALIRRPVPPLIDFFAHGRLLGGSAAAAHLKFAFRRGPVMPGTTRHFADEALGYPCRTTVTVPTTPSPCRGSRRFRFASSTKPSSAGPATVNSQQSWALAGFQPDLAGASGQDSGLQEWVGHGCAPQSSATRCRSSAP